MIPVLLNFVILTLADNAELIKIACPKLFKEIEHLSDSEKLCHIMDSRKNNPLHMVMLRKESPTTIELCSLLSEFIDPNFTNIDNLKPGQRKNDTKKNGRITKRQSILQEAAVNFQSKRSVTQNTKKKHSRKKNTKKNVSPAPIPKEPTLHQDLPVAEKKISNEAPTIALSSDQISVLITEELIFLKDKPASYFTPPPDFKRQNSRQHPNQPLSKQVSEDGIFIEPSPHTPSDTICEDSMNTNSDVKNLKFENCTWEIECSENVKKYLAHKKTPQIWKKQVINKMKEIATGGIRNSHRTSGTLGDNIHETRFSKGGRILWEVAIQFSPRLTAKHVAQGNEKEYFYSDVIRIWAVVSDHDNLEREINKIKASQSRGQTAAKPIPLYYKKNEARGNKRNPQYYKYCEQGISETVDSASFYPAGSTKNDEYNVATFYTVNSIFERSMIEGSEARRDFPFKEWPKEHDIINMPEGKESILLLGRSGTGKTTCCLYRLWNQFHLFWSNEITVQHRALPFLKSEVKVDMQEVLAKYDSESTNSGERDSIEDDADLEDHEDTSKESLHQIFITKNYVLCSQMKKRFYDLAAGSSKTAQHTQFEDTEPPLSLCDVEDRAFPLFLTARQFFIILDNSLKDGNTFFQRDDRGALMEKILSSDYDHEDPDTLFDLEESDSEVEYHEGDDADDADFKTHAAPKIKLRERHEITANYFITKIWPKISKSASIDAKLDPLLVWMEIKSFIKGSQNAAEKEEGYLSKGEYNDLGEKMAANYCEKRDEIYKIFENYLRYIQNSKEMLFDDCELIHSLYSRLNHLEDLPWSIHSIYVDEVQDFTQAELSILLRICRNPNNLFLTGDTAQSIMRGISFRFGDLRYLFHCAKEKVLTKKKKPYNIVVPKVLDLQINFRSHTGVLNLAASIIDVMKNYFASSFDCLPGDEGMFTGPMPIVVESSNISDLALVMHTNRRESSKKIEFGAHQVIIVQSEEAKRNLPDVLKSSIVLTVFESKGLEFDDVLLFDFFKDSQVSYIIVINNNKH